LIKIALYKKTDQGNYLQRFAKKFFIYSAYTMIVAALLVLPFSFGINESPVGSKPAFAKAGGNGGGNGNGNNGNGNNGNSSSNSNSSNNGNAYGHSKASKSNHGATASALGKSNAAHASPNAMANAADNSTVGQIAAALGAFATDLASSSADVVDAALTNLSEALGKFSNKSVDEDVAQAVVDIAEAKSARSETD